MRLEGLERRRLLAAAVSVVAGKLTVTGTSAGDSIALAPTTGGLNLTIDGTTQKLTQTITAISLVGSDGDDVLTIDDAVVAKATIVGGNGNDKLRGGGGNDSLDGGAGNDTVDGGKGGDMLKGGSGSADTVDYSSRANNVTIGIGTLYDDGEAGEKDNVYADVEIVVCGSGNDSVKASAVDNTVQGNGGNDTVYAQTGNDAINGGAGDDVIYALGGNDILVGGAGNDSLVGGKGGDILNGGDNNDTLIGGEAQTGETELPDNDLLIGGNDNDKIYGGSDNDTVIGGLGDDFMAGGSGDDNISGEEGNDRVYGNTGNDTLDGGTDNDTMSGDEGVDSMLGGDGDDDLTDTGVTPSEDSIASQESEAAPAFLAGGTGNDTLVADSGNVVMQGEDGEDLIVGGNGNDILDGGLDSDTIEGNGGRDTITGGAGEDSLGGGSGNDLFVNNDGVGDVVDGGADVDISQVEESLLDQQIGVEGRYDQPEDEIIIDPNDPFQDQTPLPVGIIAGKGELAAVVVQPAPTLVGGQLKITPFTNSDGTAFNDIIQVTQGATIDVTHNGVFHQFPVANVLSIFIETGGGNDVVILELSKGTASVTKPSTISGGAGNDNLRGGSGPDQILGSAGSDSLLGGGGNDLCSGGDGNDYLIGGSPNLLTADGTDQLFGGAGAGDYADYGFRSNALVLRLDGVANDGAAGENDLIGADVEYLLGGRGNDLLVGNAGANLLAGGGGNDTMKGGGGNDQLVASYTKDTKVDSVFGNSGYDYLFIEDKVRDDYNGSLSTDFFRTDINTTTGGALDVLVPDQL